MCRQNMPKSSSYMAQESQDPWKRAQQLDMSGNLQNAIHVSSQLEREVVIAADPSVLRLEMQALSVDE